MADFDEGNVSKDICSSIKYVVKNFPKRNAGSDGEKMTAEYFAQTLGSLTDDVKEEEFTLYPSAHMSWTVITAVCAILALAAYFFSAALALFIMIVGLVPYIAEYALIHRAIDPLFKPAKSVNVTAVSHCSDEAKKRIYFVAHVDASPEWTLQFRLGTVAFKMTRAFNVIGVFYIIALSLARWISVGALGAGIASGAYLYAGLAGLIFLITWGSCFFFLSRKVVSDGANDNLTGCFVAINALKRVSGKLKNTDVGVILTGGNSCGLRGAKEWCDRHKSEVEGATFIALDTLREGLNVNSKELMGLQKASSSASELVLNAAKEIGAKCTNRPAPFGTSTDSAAFKRAGLDSCGVMGVDRNLPDYFRTRYDTYDNLSEECIDLSYRLVLKIVEDFSGESLDLSSDSEKE